MIKLHIIIALRKKLAAIYPQPPQYNQTTSGKHKINIIKILTIITSKQSPIHLPKFFIGRISLAWQEVYNLNLKWQREGYLETRTASSGR